MGQAGAPSRGVSRSFVGWGSGGCGAPPRSPLQEQGAWLPLRVALSSWMLSCLTQGNPPSLGATLYSMTGPRGGGRI